MAHGGENGVYAIALFLASSGALHIVDGRVFAQPGDSGFFPGSSNPRYCSRVVATHGVPVFADLAFLSATAMVEPAFTVLRPSVPDHDLGLGAPLPAGRTVRLAGSSVQRAAPAHIALKQPGASGRRRAIWYSSRRFRDLARDG